LGRLLLEDPCLPFEQLVLWSMTWLCSSSRGWNLIVQGFSVSFLQQFLWCTLPYEILWSLCILVFINHHLPPSAPQPLIQGVFAPWFPIDSYQNSRVHIYSFFLRNIRIFFYSSIVNDIPQFFVVFSSFSFCSRLSSTTSAGLPHSHNI